jgi:hypothetical protein
MRYRKLRIAWSALGGLAAALLLLLWVRSYFWSDIVQVGAGKSIFISFRGQSYFDGGVSFSPPFDLKPSEKKDRAILRGKVHVISIFVRLSSPLLAAANNIPNEFDIVPFGHVAIPFWSLLLLALVLSAAPWIPRRFSLRTLLIATTLLAVVLGLIVWVAR